MKKLFLLLMIAVLSLTACSSSSKSSSKNQNNGQNNKQKSGQKQVITVLSHPAYSSQASDPKRANYIKQHIKTFESKNANFTIKNNIFSTNESQAMAKILERASQGRAPDAAQIDSYLLPRYYKYLQPLNGLLKKNNIKLSDFFPFAQKVMKGPDGKIYAIQFTTDTRVLYYRKDLVPNPPKTWADVLKIGAKLKKEGYTALVYPGGRGQGMMVTTLLPMFWGQGGKLFNKQGKPIFGTGQNKMKMLNVLNFLNKTVKQGVAPKRVSTYANENDLNSEVATKKVAMFMGGSWQASEIKNIFGQSEFKKWGVAPIPQKAGAQNKTSAGGWSWGIFTKNKKKQQAAFNYLKNTYFGNEGMANWTSLAGYLPVRKSIYNSNSYKNTKFSSNFKNLLNNNADVRPSSKNYPTVSNALEVAVSSVLSGSKTPKQALNDAWNAVKNK